MKRLKIGDVFEIKTPKGNAYFQYAFQNETVGELIRILPGLFEIEPGNINELVNENEVFFIHFPLKAAFKQGIVRYVGNIELPQHTELPNYMRSKKVDRNGKFECWHIINYKTWERESVNELNQTQLRLSPWGTWNDTLLIERLSDGWTPEIWK
jgi:hypothetical protein